MASNFKIATAVRNDACDAIVDRIDGGTGAGTLEIRDNTIPTNPSDASVGTLLADITLNNPAFGAASSGAATLITTPTVSVTAIGSSTATYFRIYAGAAADTACEMQGTAGIDSGTFDLQFDNPVIVSGGTVTITTIVITVPEQ